MVINLNACMSLIMFVCLGLREAPKPIKPGISQPKSPQRSDSIGPGKFTTLYVDDNAPARGDGTTWNLAFCSLQDALAVAQDGTVSEIRVAGGTYRPILCADPTLTPEATFELLDGVALRGGFAGRGAPNPDARDPALYPSILTGDMNGDDLPDFRRYGDNAYHVVVAYGTSESSVLDGFTITSGNADPAYSTGSFLYGGAGLYCSEASPTITNCLFTKHSAKSYSGGAVLVQGGSPVLTRCRFVGNGNLDRYSYCGGVVCDGSHCLLQDCVFVGNAGDFGSAVYGRNNASIRLVNCVIAANVGYDAAIVTSQCDLTLTNCVVAYNRSIAILPSVFSLYPAGIRIQDIARTTITNCIIWGNRNDNGAGLDAQFQAYGGSPAINYSCVQGLSADFPGAGNDSADPHFVDPDGSDNVLGTLDDDFSLRPGSPCIDAGDNEADTDRVTPGNQPPPAMDARGSPRFVNDPLTPDSGHGSAPIIDMGAYEGPRPTFIWDANEMTVTEGGSATTHVRLTSDPGGPLVVAVARVAGDADVSVVGTGILNFDSSNYAVPQAVTLAASEDVDYRNGVATIQANAAGFVPGDLLAHELDNDPAPAIVYVKSSANGAGDGRSWSDAFPDLQQALDAAADRSEIHQVWVAAGTYRPSRRVIAQNRRTSTFSMLPGLAIYGGFAGTETALGQRDPAAHPTILTGDLDGDDTGNFDSQTRSENAYSVVGAVNIDETATLDGFTITHGHANKVDPQSNGRSGAGIKASHAKVSFANCDIKENFANVLGAAMDVESESKLTMSDCRIELNAVGTMLNPGESGGTAYVRDSDSDFVNCSFLNNTVTGYNVEAGALFVYRGAISLTNCTIQGNAALANSSNTASSYGGGIVLWDSMLNMVDCRVLGNRADEYGGMVFDSDFPAFIDTCIFSGNVATKLYYGDVGALSISAGDSVSVRDTVFESNTSHGYAGAVYSSGPVHFLNCTFHANTSLSTGSGGGLSASHGALIEDCLFQQNRAYTGGGLYLVGSYSGSSVDLPVVRRSRFENNQASRGGGLYISRGRAENCEFVANQAEQGGGLNAVTTTVTGCRLFGNRATGMYSYTSGGGLFVSGNSDITNCVFSGNWAAKEGGAISANGDLATRIANCTLAGNTSGLTTGGLSVGHGRTYVDNCIFWGNGPQPTEAAQISGPNLLLNHNCIQGLTGTLGGEGNIDDDPLFVDADGADNVVGTRDDDLHLGVNSPCVNAGDNHASLLPELDVDGQPRIQQCRVDIGADESPHVTFTDCNANGLDDACDIWEGRSSDCNQNDVPDECDLTAGTSDDRNHNGVPDECEMRIIHVNAAATPPGDGRHWNTAFADLQDALTAAAGHPGDVQIWIAAGTYRPAPPGGPRTATFLLSDRLGLYGGFAGYEHHFGQRDPDTNVTILSGDLAGDDANVLSDCCTAHPGPGCIDPPCMAAVTAHRPSCATNWDSTCAALARNLCPGIFAPLNSENCFHVVTGYFIGPSVTLDGLTITGGNAGSGALNWNGGNVETNGGGLYLIQCGFTIQNCNVTANRAQTYGGGLYALGGNIRMVDSEMTNNRAGEGGGAYLTESSSVEVRACRIAHNSLPSTSGVSQPRGGGLRATAGSVVVVSNSVFDGNTGGTGTGIAVDLNAVANIDQCIFTNQSDSSVYMDYFGSAQILNSLFSHNASPAGSAVSHNSSLASSLIGCTIVANSSTSSYGGAVYVGLSGRDLSVLNCIVSGNTSPSPTIENAQIYKYSSNTPLIVAHSCIQGLNHFAGNGNIGADPAFVNAENSDFRLSAGSPCIDAGDNAAVPLGFGVDLAGRLRFVDDPATPDTGSGTPPIVDMGAYERPGPPIVVAVDVDPGKCPNRLWRHAAGTFKIAILGSAAFDVHAINPETVQLRRADGIGGMVTPRLHHHGGHPPTIHDVAAPYNGNLCGCWQHHHDGHVDMVFRFDIHDAVDALEMGSLPSLTDVPLILSGQLLDLRTFQGSDCVRLYGN